MLDIIKQQQNFWKKQWTWLEKEVKNSSARLNILVSGIQVIPSDHK